MSKPTPKYTGLTFDCPVCRRRCGTSVLNKPAIPMKLYLSAGKGQGKGFSHKKVPMDPAFKKTFTARLRASIRELKKVLE